MPQPERPSAQTLAAFYAGLRIEQIPEATRHAARRHLLDTLGAGLAGAMEPEPTAARHAAWAAYGAGGSSSLWGLADTAAPAAAALVNGVAAHALELDDASGCDHSGAVVVPAIMAGLDAAPEGTSGDDVIAALVAGYDLGRRVMEAAGGYDAHNGAGWHSTGTCGVFASTAALARLHRLDPSTAAHALGIAGSYAAGGWAFLADGAMTKRLHAGNAAAAGIMAVALARHGMTGPHAIFEAQWGGFLPTYAAATARPALLTEALGQEWRIHRSSIKPFASCRGTHAAIEIALALRNTIPAGEVASVRVGTNEVVSRMCGRTGIRTLVDAQMSLPYSLAVAWLHGEAGLEMFREEVRQRSDVQAWAAKVAVVHDPTIESGVAARVVVSAADGRLEERRIDVPLGSAGHPLPDDGLVRKYEELATPRLGHAGARRLADFVWSLSSAPDAARLPGLLAAPLL